MNWVVGAPKMTTVKSLRGLPKLLLLYSGDHSYLSWYTTACSYPDNSKLLFSSRELKKDSAKDKQAYADLRMLVARLKVLHAQKRLPMSLNQNPLCKNAARHIFPHDDEQKFYSFSALYETYVFFHYNRETSSSTENYSLCIKQFDDTLS